MIRSATLSDSEAIAHIYNHYIENTTITFEEEPVSIQEMANRLNNISAEALPWIVAELDGKVIGYAYATKWRARAAYRHSVETTVYLDQAFLGRGYGKLLYEALLSILRQKGIHTAIGGIALPNESSVVLHERLGFTNVAILKEIGNKFNQWIDVGYWQIHL